MEQLKTPAGGDEYREAFAALRRAKNVFLTLVLLAIVVQLTAAVLVRTNVGGCEVLAAPPPATSAPASAPATSPAEVDLPPQTPPATAPADEAAAATQPTTASARPARDRAARKESLVGTALICQNTLRWALPLTKFVGLTVGMLLVLTLLLAVKLSLVARTGGVAGFLSAFFLSLLAWVFLIPWQQLLHPTFASGALLNLDTLLDYTRKLLAARTLIDQVLYYARVVVYPASVGILLIAAQLKFAGGWRRMTLSVERLGGEPKL